jgi:hypothetical protein
LAKVDRQQVIGPGRGKKTAVGYTLTMLRCTEVSEQTVALGQERRFRRSCLMSVVNPKATETALQ